MSGRATTRWGRVGRRRSAVGRRRTTRTEATTQSERQDSGRQHAVLAVLCRRALPCRDLSGRCDFADDRLLVRFVSVWRRF